MNERDIAVIFELMFLPFQIGKIIMQDIWIHMIDKGICFVQLEIQVLLELLKLNNIYKNINI